MNQITPFKKQGDASDGALGLVRVRGLTWSGGDARDQRTGEILQQQQRQELGLAEFLGLKEPRAADLL